MEIRFSGEEMIAILQAHGIDVVEEDIEYPVQIGPFTTFKKSSIYVPYKNGVMLGPLPESWGFRGMLPLISYQVEIILQEKMFQFLTT